MECVVSDISIVSLYVVLVQTSGYFVPICTFLGFVYMQLLNILFSFTLVFDFFLAVIANFEKEILDKLRVIGQLSDETLFTVCDFIECVELLAY